MKETNSETFNVNPLLYDIEKVIKSGLNDMLSNYMKRYELLEETHNQIMNLPSVLHELRMNNNNNNNINNNNNLKIENNNFDTFISIKDMTRDIVQENVSSLEKRLDKMEKKNDAIYDILDKLLSKIAYLNNEIKDLKINTNSKNISQLIQTGNIEKSSVIEMSKNENIEIIIEEVSEKEYEHEISDDENDINPLITCSTIILNKNETESNQQESLDQEKPEQKEQGQNQEEPDQEEPDQEEPDQEEPDQEEPDQEEPDQEEQDQEEEDQEEQDQEEQDQEEEDQEEQDQEEQDQEEQDRDEQDQEEQDQEEQDQEEQDQDEDVDNDSVETETKKELDQESEDEEYEIFEIDIDDKTYCTNDEENGFIWELTDEGEQGDKVGYLKDGEPFFYADEK